ncbi:hypothetical protein Tco_0341109 [Tanacetum coccineum]
MANIDIPLFHELSRAADSHDIRDQLSLLFRREVAKDLVKMEDYFKLSNELRIGVETRDGYISELQIFDMSKEVFESIEILRLMQVDDMEKASCLALMAREIQDKVCLTLVVKIYFVKDKKRMVPVRMGYCIFELLSSFGNFDASWLHGCTSRSSSLQQEAFGVISGGDFAIYFRNYGVTCEDEAKRRNSGAKTKTFEENCYLPLYADNAFNGMNGWDVTDHISKENDRNTKNGLWEFYRNERTKGTIGDLSKYKDQYKDNTKKTCSDTFYKPYLDAQEANDIYEAIDKEYYPLPIPAHRDIDNSDELCRTEEFTVV